MARRPPEAIPPPRHPAPSGPRRMPRYRTIPRWGLHDVPAAPPRDRRARLGELADWLHHALRLLSVVLGVAALVHLIRYLVLVINRSTPIPGWIDVGTASLVFAGGLLGLGVFVYATVVFTRWVIALRDDAYRRHDRRDPRRRWLVIVAAAIPLINVVGAALLLHEVASVRDDLDDEVTRPRLTRVWVAWVLVNALALIAVVTRLAADLSGSIQTGADGLAAVVISSAVSAVFARWLGDRLDRIFGDAEHAAVPSRRWVAVA